MYDDRLQHELLWPLSCTSRHRFQKMSKQHSPHAPTRTRLKTLCIQLLSASFALLSLLSPSLLWAQESPQLDLQRVKIQAGFFQIDAQVALSPEQRSVGLMFRKDMPQHEGMIFVFEQAAQQCFWMKNTLLPLSAAFVADDGSIVNIVDMKPQTLDSHCSAKPVRFVLEMHQGWFSKKNIQAGFKLGGVLFKSP